MGLSKRNIVLIVAALVSVFAAILVRNHLGDAPDTQQAEAPQHPAVRILVAKRDLAVGTFVQAAFDLDWAPPPEAPTDNNVATPTAEATTPPAEGTVPTPPPHENYLFENAVKLSDFNGAIVRRSLHAGNPVPQWALMKAGEGGFMSAVLEPGKRAVAISVTATSGAAGFVSPGDHVDLIVTHRSKALASGGAGDDVVVSETFTHDVRVVAVDQLLDNPDNKAILAKTVTLEVTPRQAEQVAVASEMGRISLALRSSPEQEKAAEARKREANAGAAKPEGEHAKELKDLYGAEAQPEAATTSNVQDLDPSQLSGHKSALIPRVTIIRGDKSESMDFYQGK